MSNILLTLENDDLKKYILKPLERICNVGLKHVKKYQKDDEKHEVFSDDARKFGFCFLYSKNDGTTYPLLFYSGQVNLIDIKYAPYPMIIVPSHISLNPILSSQSMKFNEAISPFYYTHVAKTEIQLLKESIPTIEKLTLFTDKKEIWFEFNNTCSLNVVKSSDILYFPYYLLTKNDLRPLLQKILNNREDIFLDEGRCQEIFNDFDTGDVGESQIGGIILYKLFLPQKPKIMYVYVHKCVENNEIIVHVALEQHFISSKTKCYIFYRYLEINS